MSEQNSDPLGGPLEGARSVGNISNGQVSNGSGQLGGRPTMPLGSGGDRGTGVSGANPGSTPPGVTVNPAPTNSEGGNPNIGNSNTGNPNGNKDQWFGFWSNVTNSIIAGIFGLLTLVVGAFLSFRGPHAPSTPATSPAPSAVSADDNAYGTVLEADNPYPASVRMVALDMKLSEVKALQLPDGKVEGTGQAEADGQAEGGYSFTLASGPFASVLCTFKDARDEDPRIESIRYTFRDAGAEAIVRRQAVSAFGSKRLRSSQLGAVMRWPNVGGCHIEVDATRYTVRP